MKYNDLYKEYEDLQNKKELERIELSKCRDGYISVKKINNRNYYYLQKRVNGKVKSKYIKSENLKGIKEELKRRHTISKSIEVIKDKLSRLELAISVLDKNLYQKVLLTKRCTKMDYLNIELRREALRFADAITALEGLDTSKEAIKDLKDWADGNQGFKESYLRVLQKYKMIEG